MPMTVVRGADSDGGLPPFRLKSVSAGLDQPNGGNGTVGWAPLGEDHEAAASPRAHTKLQDGPPLSSHLPTTPDVASLVCA